MDWLHAGIQDAVWSRLLSLEGLVTFLVEEDRDLWKALHTHTSLVCAWKRRPKEHEEMDALFAPSSSPCPSLWQEVGRPFLQHVSPHHAKTVAACEVATRFLLARLPAMLAALGVPDVCIAGEFAAWQLERAVDVWRGKDGFPRTVRGTSVWDGTPKADVWVPEAMDVYVACEDLSLVRDVVGACYQRFAEDLLLVLRQQVPYLEVCVEAEEEEERADEEDERPTREYLVHLVRKYGHTEEVVDLCTRHHEAETKAHSPSSSSSSPFCVVRNVVTLSTCLSMSLPSLCPTRLRILLTDPPPGRERTTRTTTTTCSSPSYATWVSTCMDLAHCAVGLRVTKEVAYAFQELHPEAGQSLLQRRLLLLPAALRRRPSDTVHRLGMAIVNGCSPRGDDHWPSADEREEALREMTS